MTKYFAHKCQFDGLTFDSTTERDRYITLLHQQKIGVISNLRRQMSYTIIPKQTRQQIVHLKTKDKVVERVIEQAAHYTCDFIYKENGCYVMEEVKSSITKMARDYPLRRKLMIQKIEAHNKKNRSLWKFREVEYKNKKTITIKDY